MKLNFYTPSLPGWLLVVCVASAALLPAQTFTLLHEFNGSDGGNPQSGLVQAIDGNLYGTNPGSSYWNTRGIIYGITPSGVLKTLYNFCPEYPNCPNGSTPVGGLVQEQNGGLYGVIATAVFKVTLSGVLDLAYQFCLAGSPGCTDNLDPIAGLVEASDRYLYGTTAGIGELQGGGTVFRMTPSGKLTTLYSFCSQSGCPDGEVPNAPLVQDRDGNFYGTTSIGGAYEGGTVFRITPSGTLTTIYSFCAPSPAELCPDGARSLGGLVQGSNGNLYGTTSSGANSGGGTIFEITYAGKFSTLYRFCSQTNCADGAAPMAGLIQGTDGNFYGTTSAGGSGLGDGDGGTIFRITPAGELTTLYSFCSQDGGSCDNGYYPAAPLVQHTNGDFYGTTITDGVVQLGTVFSLSVGLSRFAKLQTTSGRPGETIQVLGTAFTGATSVTFDGTEATFEVVSSSLITTKVPSGAKSGTVEVVTPSGTLLSNVPFQVLK